MMDGAEIQYSMITLWHLALTGRGWRTGMGTIYMKSKMSCFVL